MDSIFQHTLETNSTYCISCNQFYEHLVPIFYFHNLWHILRYRCSCPSPLYFPFFEKFLISFTSCNMLIVIGHLEIIMPPKFPTTESTSHNVSHCNVLSSIFHLLELDDKFQNHILYYNTYNTFRHSAFQMWLSYL